MSSKKNITIALLFLMSLSTVLAQSKINYYYYQGKKVDLYIDKSKINLISDIETILQESESIRDKFSDLSFNEETVFDSRQKFARVNFKNIPSDKEFQDGITLLKQNIATKHIAYYYYHTEKGSLGTSNVFYVSLKSSSDFELLKELAEQRGVEIIKQVPFMDQWYALKIRYNTEDTSVEASNFFYETGLFLDVDPGFIFNFNSTCTNDTMFGSLWGLNNSVDPNIDINACQAWGLSLGTNIKVAVVDQGIEKSHSDLNSNISALSFNSISGTSPSFEPSAAGPYKNGHGTQVAGVIAAVRNNTLQVVGVAPQAKLMSVSNDMYPYRSTISAELASGISWAYQNGADVINNSWGDAGGLYTNLHSSILETSIVNAMNLGRSGKGSLVVFAAGNEGASGQIIDYPANFHTGIITVGAITSTGNRSSFSGYGIDLDIVAPGSGILTTGQYSLIPSAYVQNNTQTVDGTSFAAPHVSGVIALMLSANPNLTRCQVANIIETTSQKVGGYSYTTTSGRTNGTWNNEMGYGLVDAYSAVLAAQSSSGGLPIISGASPVCTNQIYSLTNFPSGSSYTWSSSYSSGLSINPSTGLATRINSHCGYVTLTADINTSGCSSYVKRDIWVGAPLISNAILDGTTSLYSSSPAYICPGSHWITVTPIGPGASSASWTVQSGVPYTITTNYLDFYMYSNVSSIAITSRSSNTCGTGPNFAFYLMKKTWGCPSSFAISVYPNPATDEITIETINTVSQEEQPPLIELAVIMDSQGIALSTSTTADHKTKLNVKGIRKGMYYLQMKIGNEIFKEQILIE